MKIPPFRSWFRSGGICVKMYANKRIGGKHTNRTEISVSVCILSTDGQAALRIKEYVVDALFLNAAAGFQGDS